MGYCNLFLLAFAYLLARAAAKSSASFVLPQLVDHEQQDIVRQELRKRSVSQNVVMILKRAPTRPRPSRTDTDRAATRSQTQPNLGINRGGVRAKDSRPSRRGRSSASTDGSSSKGSRATGSTVDAATTRTASTERTIRYETRPASGHYLRAIAAGSSSSGRSSLSTSSSNSLSHSSQDSPPGTGNIFAQGSTMARLGSTPRSLSGFEDVVSPARSVQSQRSTLGGSVSDFGGRSNVATSPGSSRGSLPSRVSLSSSAGLPSLFEAMSIQRSSSTSPTLMSVSQRPTQDRGRIHDSPSSLRSARLPQGIPIRSATTTSRPGQNQVRPESPSSRIGSLTGENGSSQDGRSDRGSDLEHLDSHLGRLGFGH